MIYAVTLGGWLIWAGVGSYFAALTAGSTLKKETTTETVLVISALLLPFIIIFIRSYRYIFGFSAGESIGIVSVLIAAIILAAPTAFLFGAIYVLLNKEWRLAQNDSENAWRVYLWESIGACAGGVLFSFLLIGIFDTFEIAIFIPWLVLISFILLSKNKVRFYTFTLIFFIFLPALWFSPQLDLLTKKAEFPGLELLVNEDSAYGQITITKRDDMFSLYENGQLAFSTGDDLTAQESIHYAMLSHLDPNKALLISGGLGGSLNELLKYPELRVDYVELDPELIKIARKTLPREEVKILKNDRVNMIFSDGRRYISTSRKKYDVIILNLSDPRSAMLNRYYSFEFFLKVKELMAEGAIFSFGISSSSNYLNPENKAFLRTIYTTVRSVFPYVISLPGDRHIFIASERPVIISPEAIRERMEARSVQADHALINSFSRLDPFRTQQMRKILSIPGDINKDERPVGYLYELKLWASHFGWNIGVITGFIKKYGSTILTVITAFIVICGYLLRRSPFHIIDLSIAITGFSEIVYQILIIFAFQVLYGFVYSRIGIITAAFMGGLCLGTILAGKLLRNGRELFSVYKWVQAGICVYPLIIPSLFISFKDMDALKYALFIEWLFVLLPIIAGFMGGMQYPLALYIRGRITPSIENNSADNIVRSAGILYSFDIFGAGIGAIFTGIFLLPIFGITEVSMTCFVLNLAVLIGLFLVKQK
jgi:spermidine synthase